MLTKLELLQKIAEAGIKLNKGKMTKKDLLVILKKAKEVKGNKADEFRRITKTDSADLAKKSYTVMFCEKGKKETTDEYKTVDTEQEAKQLVSRLEKDEPNIEVWYELGE